MHAGLAYPSVADYKWILQANQLCDCHVSVNDSNTAIKIWGLSVTMMNGKMTWTRPPPVQQDVIAIPREFREIHKCMALTIDIFFVNTNPFLATNSLNICFLPVTHMANWKADTIVKALKEIYNYYLQQGFSIVFIKANNEFKPLEPMMLLLCGGRRLNLSSANEHVPEIKQRNWVDLDGNVLHEITGVDLADDMKDNHTEAIEELSTLAVQFDLEQTLNEQPVGNGQTLDVQSIGDVAQSMPQSEANAGPVKTTNPVVRRSSWAKTAVKTYVPSMQGKRYSFAMTQLGCRLLDSNAFQYDPRVAVCFMQQLSAKAALNEWGEDAEAAGLKDTSQLHWRKSFIPKLYN